MADADNDTTRKKARPSKRAAELLDIRRIIGGLLFLYGVILTITGLFDSHAEKTKAAGWNVNLGTGIGLLVVGGLFIFWSMTRPFVDAEELSDD